MHDGCTSAIDVLCPTDVQSTIGVSSTFDVRSPSQTRVSVLTEQLFGLEKKKFSLSVCLSVCLSTNHD